MRIVKDSSGRRRRRRGASAVEFAVILPVLMLLVLGAVDFGRFASTYIAVTNAARAAAAFGAMNPYSTVTQSTWTAQVKQAAFDEMSGYDTSLLSVTTTPTSEADGLWRVSVVASYPFKTVVSWPGIPTSDGQAMILSRTVVVRAIR